MSVHTFDEQHDMTRVKKNLAVRFFYLKGLISNVLNESLI